MKSFTMLIYSIAAYLVGFASIVYWILSVSNLIPEISIDQEPRVPFLLALLNNLTLVALFGVQHSIMARPWFKDFFSSYFPRAIERSTFILVSGVLLFFLVIQWQPLGGLLWDVSSNVTLNYIMYTLFFIGWSILFISTFLINHLDFFGLRQVYFEIIKKPYKPLNFKVVGFYKHMRHPIYFGGMLGLWATPVMTSTHFFFAFFLSIYFIVGTFFEEKDLKQEFGNLYKHYVANTPMYIPFTKKSKTKKEYLKRMEILKNKTKLMMLLAMLSTAAITAQTIAIPDTNFEQALIDLGHDTNGLNGNILQSEAEAVTSLDVNSKNISSLQGIEGFINVTVLRCHTNNLTALDLSSNTALVQLNTRTNQLTSLDLSTNVALEVLNCFNNQITALDLRTNTQLRFLLCDDNDLTELSVKNGNNTNVTFFSTLGNNSLVCIEVDDESYSAANWSDISPFSFFSDDCHIGEPTIAILDDNFEIALIDLGFDTNGLNGNILQSEAEALTSLNVSNKSITSLMGIEGFVNLTSLICNDNQLTSLDVSNNVNLTELYCYNNELTDLSLGNNAIMFLMWAHNNQLATLNISSNIALTELWVFNNNLTSLDTGNNAQLVEVIASDNQLTSINVENNTILNILTLDNNLITSIDVSNNSTLDLLYCQSNQLTSINAKNGNNTAFTNLLATNNPDLFCIEVDDVAYSTANWTSIDPQTNFSEDCSVAVFPTIAIPDAIFEQALIDQGYDSNGLNGNILQSEAEAVTILSVSDRPILSLEGIQGFTNLSVLYAAFTSITTIDVSANTNLTELFLASNELTTIDVSANVNLIVLSLGLNPIESINVNTNQNLKELFVSNTSLTTLDVSNNASLEILNCSTNQLTSLNIKNGNNTNFTDFNATNNPNLFCIEVDDATYSTTNWPDIDAQTNFSEDCSIPFPTIAIPDVNFEQALIDLGYDTNGLTGNILQLDAEAVTSLNVSNKNIADLTGIEGFTNLGVLDCTSNNLTSLDVSNHPTVYDIDATGNFLTDIDVSNTASLNKLDVRLNQLTSLDVSNCPVLISLKCSNNALTTLNVQNGINSNFITPLQATLNPNLFCIQVDNAALSTVLWTNIDPQASFSEDCSTAPAVIPIPDANFEQALIDLGYDTNGFTGTILKSEAEAVIDLDLNNKNIADLTGIEGFINLTFLRVANNEIDTLQGIESLSNLETLICNNNNLTSLDVSNNAALKDLQSGGNALGSLDVSNNTLLEDLNCYTCQLTSIDLSNNPNLIELELHENQLTDLDITNNPNLTYLDFSKNQLTNIDLTNYTALIEIYAYDNQLTSLNVKNGNNTIITDFQVDDNPNLFCIEVDDAAYSTANWTSIDAQTIFSEDCSTALAVIAVPDANFEQALINLGIDTNGFTGNILKSEAEAVTSLSVNNLNISSLAGIEGFVNLEQLFCSNNNLTNLDLSSNVNLTRLLCNKNQLTALPLDNNNLLESFDASENQLTDLNVENNTALHTIWAKDNLLASLDVSTNTLLRILIIENNQIVSLDFENNALVESLYLNNNLITSLDISSNGSLAYLEFESNQLTSLNVKNGNNSNIIVFNTQNNPNLLCIEVDDAAYSTANWTDIDAQTSFSEDCSAAFPTIAIPDANFEQALIDFGYDTNGFNGNILLSDAEAVTSLDVNSKNISSLQGIEGFINVTVLRCHTNNLTDLDLSSNTALVQLNTRTNQLTSLDVSANAALEILNCFNNQITDLDLSTNAQLTSLLCDSNSLTSINVKNGNNTNVTFFSALGNPNLNCIEVDDTAYSTANWTDIDAQTIFSEDCSSAFEVIDIPDANFEQALIDLGYDTNGFTGTILKSEAEAVTTLIIIAKNIASLSGIEGFVNLTELNCSFNNLTSLDVSNNNALEILNCSENLQLTTLVLGNNTVLNHLDAKNCQLTTITVEDNTALIYLKLSGNLLTTLDVSNNTLLTELYCHFNQLSSLNAKNGNNTSITNFEAYDNPNLYCIEVDNTPYSTANWTDIDAQINFSEDCSDTTAPIITLIGNNPQTIELGDGYTELGATTDDGSDVVIDASEFTDAVGTYTVRYNATDAAGNTAIEVTRTVSVEDNADTTAPIITLTGNNPQIIELGEGYTELGATTDDGSAVVIDASDFVDAVGTYTVRYNATDAAGNMAIEVTRTVSVEDNSDTTAPIITLNGNNPQIIELGDGYTELGATTDDGSAVVIDASDFVDAVGTYTIRYNATDTAGNTAIEVTRTVSVEDNADTTAPIITLTGNNPQTIELGDGYTELGATTDDGSTVVIDTSDFVDAVGTYTVRYNATDAAGNTAIEVTRTVNVEDNSDTTAPIITLIGNNPQIIELGDGYTELGATTDDGSTVIIDASDVVDVVGTYTVRYNATDAAGNTAIEVTRTVNVEDNSDTTAPIITLIGNNPQIIELGDGYTELGATTDDGSTVIIDASDFVDAVGTYTIRYNATDAAGNVAIEVTRTVSVEDNADTTAPIITLIGNNPQTIELGDGYTELGATTDDGSTVVIDASDFVDAVGTYTVRYNATDAAGNMAIEVTRTVSVEDNADTTAPIITLIGNNPQIIELGDGYTELGATTDDGSTVVIDATDFVDAVGTYTVRYNATDAAGNMAIEVTRTVSVEDNSDTTAPIITLIGNNPQTIELGDGYTELGATTDDGSTVVIDASDFVDAVGTYTVRYNATDAAGNMAIEVTRTVSVEDNADTTAPIITLIGNNPQIIELGDGYTELGATTDDGSTVVIDATDFVDAVGTYTVRYNATDAAGNMAIEVTRTVSVEDNSDTTAPIITLIGNNPQTIELGDGYTELGATTDDGSTVIIDASDFVDAVGTYTVRYNATDAAGNTAIEVTRTVSVEDNSDTTAPIITLIGNNPQIIELGDGYTELGATTDDGSTVVIDASDVVDAEGTYTVRYNATDAAGNMAIEVTRTVSVEDNSDTTAPIITLIGSNPQTIELGDGYTELGATTDDGSMVIIDASDVVDAVGTYTVRYNAMDAAGNSAIEVTRTVNVVNTAPTIPIPDANFEQALIDLGYDTNGFTGNILKSEAEAVTILNVNDKNISSLSGIEGFINLTELRCSNNNLTSLDVSSNLALTFLNAESNLISNLDITNNVSLVALYFFENSLIALDVSNNSNLKELQLASNNIMVLDVSNNLALEMLRVGNNQLTDLDVSSNTLLEIMSCDKNALTSLNIKNGNNTIIIDFKASENPDLYCIEVDDAAYSTLNWTGIDAQATFSEDCSTLGEEDVSLEDILSLYPNPASDAFFIKGLQEETQVTIYDINGRRILTTMISNNQSVNVNQIPSGIYLVNIKNNTGETVKKLVVK